MIIAIDFDGTIVDDNGNAKPHAFETIKALQKKNTLILWTCRGGEFLDEAVNWLKVNNIVFDAVNENIHALTSRGDEYWPRKVFAHYYIDDRVPGNIIVNWNILHEMFEKEGLL